MIRRLYVPFFWAALLVPGTVNADVSFSDVASWLEANAELLKPDEAEVLEDLIVAATNDARARLETKTQEEMSKVTGGLNLPPGMKLPF